MAIKAEDGCACPLICWTHCSPGPRFILLLCRILCKRNWKNQVWLRALWGSKLLRRREKKRWDSSFCCSAVKDSSGAPACLMCVYSWNRSLEVGEQLPKYLGLALSWPSCRLGWSHCPHSPCPWLCWELPLGTTAQPEIHCWEATALGSWLAAEGFPWRSEITCSPRHPPSLWLLSNESVSYLKCIFHNCSEVLGEGKLTVFNLSSVLFSLWPLLVFYMKMINLI